MFSGMGPSRPHGSVRSPSPSTRGWRLAPPSNLCNKNNCRGCRARNVEEADESCVVCLAPLYDNTMLFRTACQHSVHACCMKGVFEFGETNERKNRCPKCRGWVWGYWQPTVPKVSPVDNHTSGTDAKMPRCETGYFTTQLYLSTHPVRLLCRGVRYAKS